MSFYCIFTSIKYINNGKVIIQTSGNGNLKDTIYDIFGKEIYSNIIELNYELNKMKISGVLGLPSISRSTRMHQFTFINSRYIKDKTINTAIDRGCEQKYAINKFPFIVLNVQIDPSHIDVNVHPAKLEVKFDDESKVFDVIYYAIKSAIEEHDRKKSPFTNIKTVENVDKVSQISKDLLNNGIIKSSEKEINRKYDFGEISTNILQESLDNQNIYKTNINENKINIYDNFDLNNIENKQQDSIVVNSSSQNIEYVENIEMSEINSDNNVSYRYVGQVFDTYIVIQIKERMYIIDQHAAHERLLYEQIKQSYYNKDKQSQILLIPVLVELTTKEVIIVNKNIEMFEKAGFMIEDFGDNAIKISGVPNIGYDIDYKSMFKDIIDELLGASKTETSEKEFRFLATLACKAAVKGRMKLDEQEQIALIEEMVKLDNPFTCPHGRPTAYEISKYEIERRFLRK